MHLPIVDGDSRLSFWLRVREFAVPPSMIESATARRNTGDWAGACAAAHVDVDLNLRTVADTHGGQLAAQVRADLRELAPDLLRWHLPRVAPDGLLRPGLTVSLARYPSARNDRGPVHLVARTPPAWAAAGQRFSLTLWDGGRFGAGLGRYPHPRPHRRFRLDLHRHLWDARRAGELRARSGTDRPVVEPDPLWSLPSGCAVDRWAAEAGILLHAEGRSGGALTVRLGTRRRLILNLTGIGDTRPLVAPSTGPGRDSRLPVLPDAATWVPPDLALLHAGLIDADRLHPLVAAALAPGRSRGATPRAPGHGGDWRAVECRGALHRIGLVDGVLSPLDHDPDEVRREELLAALTGTPMPCLQAIDEARREPECLVDVRARIDHGDLAGALTTVEGLLGPDAVLADGALRDELAQAAQRRITYGLFRAGLATKPAPLPRDRRPSDLRFHPRHATR